MTKLKMKVLAVLYFLKLSLSRFRLWIGKKLGLIRAVMIMPYQGFGNDKRIVFPGKGIEGQGNRLFAVGGQPLAKLQKDVQAIRNLDNSEREGRSIFSKHNTNGNYRRGRVF
jgi:hypothetical protein